MAQRILLIEDNAVRQLVLYWLIINEAPPAAG